MQATAFVSGGFVPEAVRGTVNNGTFHIVDWYPTFARLAGVDGTDDPPVPPLPVDPAQPDRDIYQGNQSYPGVDGRDIWDQLTGANSSAVHPSLWLSAEALIKDGRFKLVVAQPRPELMSGKAERQEHEGDGWRQPDGTWVSTDTSNHRSCRTFHRRHGFRPCLFDLDADPREEHDLAHEQPELLAQLWTELNITALTKFDSRSPKALLGVCNKECTKEHFGTKHGPTCGVPGCFKPDKEAEADNYV